MEQCLGLLYSPMFYYFFCVIYFKCFLLLSFINMCCPLAQQKFLSFQSVSSNKHKVSKYCSVTPITWHGNNVVCVTHVVGRT